MVSAARKTGGFPQGAVISLLQPEGERPYKSPVNGMAVVDAESRKPAIAG